jgi:hypothetical protein
MTVPFKVALKIYQGATFRWRATLKNGSPAIVTDLTGYTARMQVRGKITDVAPLVELTTENDGIALGDTAGTIDLFISHTDTADFDWTAGVYDLELITPGGDVIRRIYGSVSVVPEVTR